MNGNGFHLLKGENLGSQVKLNLFLMVRFSLFTMNCLQPLRGGGMLFLLSLYVVLGAISSHIILTLCLGYEIWYTPGSHESTASAFPRSDGSQQVDRRGQNLA